MLFDQRKKSFALAATTIKAAIVDADRVSCWSRKPIACWFPIAKRNSPQLVGIVFVRRKPLKRDDLIAAHAGGFVHLQGVKAIEDDVALRTYTKNAAAKPISVEPFVI